MIDFEWALVNAFNAFFQEKDIDAVAYRLKQSRYTSQAVDILVDSRNRKYYLAVECKSLDARKTKALYFSQHFNASGNSHQVQRETDFMVKSGRRGVLAVELRRGPGRPKTAHLVPWEAVRERYEGGMVGLTVEEIEAYTVLTRKGGEYETEELAKYFLSGPKIYSNEIKK